MNWIPFASAGGDMVTTLLSNAQQNYYNRQLAEYQNAWNLEMWNKQNEYNSPIETMKRLTDAGINPRNSSGLQSFANAADAPQATPYNKTSPLSAFSDVAKTMLELSNLKKQGEVLDSEEDKNRADAESKRGVEQRAHLDYVRKDPLRWQWEKDKQQWLSSEENRKIERFIHEQNKMLDYQMDKEIGYRKIGLSRYQNIYPNGDIHAFAGFNEYLKLIDRDLKASVSGKEYLTQLRKLEYKDLLNMPKSERGSFFGLQTGRLNRWISGIFDFLESIPEKLRGLSF